MTTLAQELNVTAELAKQIADRGYDLIEAGDFENALEIFDGLRLLNPRDGGAHAAAGAALHELGRHAEAEKAYDEALAIDARIVLARVNRGDLRCARGDRSGLDDLKFAAALRSPIQDRARALLKRYAP